MSHLVRNNGDKELDCTYITCWLCSTYVPEHVNILDKKWEVYSTQVDECIACTPNL